MVGMQVWSSGLCVQGPCWSRSAAEVSESEVSEMARVCWRGLVGFEICDIHCTEPSMTVPTGSTRITHTQSQQ
jgi:hypothetical protein